MTSGTRGKRRKRCVIEDDDNHSDIPATKKSKSVSGNRRESKRISEEIAYHSDSSDSYVYIFENPKKKPTSRARSDSKPAPHVRQPRCRHPASRLEPLLKIAKDEKAGAKRKMDLLDKSHEVDMAGIRGLHASTSAMLDSGNVEGNLVYQVALEIFLTLHQGRMAAARARHTNLSPPCNPDPKAGTRVQAMSDSARKRTRLQIVDVVPENHNQPHLTKPRRTSPHPTPPHWTSPRTMPAAPYRPPPYPAPSHNMEPRRTLIRTTDPQNSNDHELPPFSVPTSLAPPPRALNDHGARHTSNPPHAPLTASSPLLKPDKRSGTAKKHHPITPRISPQLSPPEHTLPRNMPVSAAPHRPPRHLASPPIIETRGTHNLRPHFTSPSHQTPAHFRAPQLTAPVPDIAERLRQMHAEREEAQRLDRRDKDSRNHKNSKNFGRFCQDEPWENINRPPSIQHGFSSSTTASSTGSGRDEGRAPNLTYTPTSSHLRSVQQQSPRDNFRQQGPPPALPLPHPVTPRPNASHHLTTTAPPRPTPQVS